MFSVTCFGHQSFMVSDSASESHLLIDPLLTPRFGQGVDFLRVYPPRQLDLSRMPPVSAVFLSHEHEDHFDIATLNRLDRSIPILLSGRSSTAGHRILEEMGFRVQRVQDSDVVRVGELELHLFSARHTEVQTGDEWDVLPFVVRSRNGDGNFISSVDVTWSRQGRARLKALVDAPGIWCFGANAFDRTFAEAGTLGDKPVSDGLGITTSILQELMSLEHEWKMPVASVVSGNGLAFADDRAWLNLRFSTADLFAVGKALSLLTTDSPVISPAPGEVLRMERGKLASIDSDCPFLSAAPREEWPKRAKKRSHELMGDYEPVTRRTELAPDEWKELYQHLAEFALYLYASPQFSGLYSMGRQDLGKRRGTFALALLCDAERSVHLLEYSPQDCRFLPVEEDIEDPFEHFVGGLECWGSDLLAIFRGERGCTNLTMGGARSWTHLPKLLELTPRNLWKFFHPLRRPDVHLKLYRHLLQNEPTNGVRVRAQRSPRVELERQVSRDA